MSNLLTEVKGWTPVIDALTNEFGLVTAAVYGVVWRYCQGEKKVCEASLETIASHLKVDRATALRHIKKLCDSGYLQDLTPELRNVPHTYADTGKAKIIGLVEAQTVAHNNSKKNKTVAENNSSVAQDNTFTQTVAQNNKTVAESYLKKEEKESKKDRKSESVIKSDPLADIFNGQNKVSESTSPNPQDQWFEYRDKAISIYVNVVGVLGKDAQEQKIRKELILGGVAKRIDFSPDCWQRSIVDSLAHNVPPGNIARFFEVYDAGGDYNNYLAKRYPGNGYTPTTKPSDPEIKAVYK